MGIIANEVNNASNRYLSVYIFPSKPVHPPATIITPFYIPISFISTMLASFIEIIFEKYESISSNSFFSPNSGNLPEITTTAVLLLIDTDSSFANIFALRFSFFS